MQEAPAPARAGAPDGDQEPRDGSHTVWSMSGVMRSQKPYGTYRHDAPQMVNSVSSVSSSTD
ncbi:hypothetical protein L13192_02162 [Pyrenophora tritici-repentis]|nr:hypothetical protein L13192_02162 [Pyrenophora tritici-repentis]KAI1687428.1 hypothetical protein KJE20_00605 [Pyrenophora tritici-repentis]